MLFKEVVQGNVVQVNADKANTMNGQRDVTGSNRQSRLVAVASTILLIYFFVIYSQCLATLSCNCTA